MSALSFHIGKFHVIPQGLHDLDEGPVQNLIPAVDYPVDVRCRGTDFFRDLRLRLVCFDTFDFHIKFYAISEIFCLRKRT